MSSDGLTLFTAQSQIKPTTTAMTEKIMYLAQEDIAEQKAY
jgi:hypothetical protein